MYRTVFRSAVVHLRRVSPVSPPSSTDKPGEVGEDCLRPAGPSSAAARFGEQRRVPGAQRRAAEWGRLLWVTCLGETRKVTRRRAAPGYPNIRAQRDKTIRRNALRLLTPYRNTPYARYSLCRADERSVIRRMETSTSFIRRITAFGLIRPTRTIKHLRVAHKTVVSEDQSKPPLIYRRAGYFTQHPAQCPSGIAPYAGCPPKLGVTPSPSIDAPRVSFCK